MFKPDDTLKLNSKTYRILKKLGEGGQAQAWQVKRESDGEVFALRVVNPYEERAGRRVRRTLAAVQSLNQRMQAEAEFLQQLPEALEHHILPCLESGWLERKEGKVFAMLVSVMQEELGNYCPSQAHEPKPFTHEQLLLWVRQLAGALAHIHQKDSTEYPHVHRDLKPSNVLLDRQGNAFLTDFGILKAARSVGTSSIAYSWECCAPEQRLPLFLRDDGTGKPKRQYHITPQADIYALGMVIHHLLLGNTRAQDELAEDSTVDEHIRQLPILPTAPNAPQPIGDLGVIGGLLAVEQTALTKHLQVWLAPKLSATGTFVPTGTTSPGLPDYPWLARRVVQFITRMLHPWPDNRPTAHDVQQEVAVWEAALSPKLTDLALEGKPTYSAEESLRFALRFHETGCGLNGWDWLQTSVDGKRQTLDWQPSLQQQGLMMALPEPLERGQHTLRVEAWVGGQQHVAQLNFEVVMSAQQLWAAGEHEQALHHELRDEWLGQLLRDKTDVRGRIDFMQLLGKLRETHPQQAALLDVYQQRANQLGGGGALSGDKGEKRKPLGLGGVGKVRDKTDNKTGAVVWLTGLFIFTVLWQSIKPAPIWVVAEAPSPALLEQLRDKDKTIRTTAYATAETLAAEGSNTNAQQWAGYRHLTGDGVTKDLQKAKDWYSKATAGGSSAAKQQLDEINKAIAAVKLDIKSQANDKVRNNKIPNEVDGEKIYKGLCFSCHDVGVVGAPKLGDKVAWAVRIATGNDAMYNTALKGKGAMPAKGGNPALSDAEVKAAVDFMVFKAK